MPFRRVSDIRWYLYRSSAKLDMLYEQVVSKKSTLSGSVALEVPFVKATLSRDRSDEPSDEERLDIVERELRERGLVGTLQEPSEYFAGEITMRWGLFDDQGRRADDASPLVFFGGVDQADAIFVGLGGSSRHVIGYHGATSTHSRSTTHAIVKWMLAGLNGLDRPQQWGDLEGERQMVMSGVAIAVHNLRPPTQRMKFLAKTLLRGDILGHEHFTGVPRASGVLGTPLYVSLVEPPSEERRWGLDDQWRLPLADPTIGLGEGDSL